MPSVTASQSEPALPAPRTLLREADVLRITSLKRTPLRNAIARGQFPKPLKLTPTRCIAFDAAEVYAWIQARADERTAA